MSRSDVHPLHVFEPWQVWPGSYDNPPVSNNFPLPPKKGPTITRSTKIASMGSCFAREIKSVLLREGYSYITEETNHPASKHASAAWERTYNTFSMRQIFQYTFDKFDPIVRWWVSPVTNVVQDPYRRIIIYNSVKEAREDFEKHIDLSRLVLESAEVLILTLGLTEIWQDKFDGSVICLPSGPYAIEGGDMSRYEFRVSRYNENLNNLEQIHETLRCYNPNCHIILTVSPVHLWATFRTDCDVISASCNSKSTLRAVVDEFVSRHSSVSYFPAFEMAAIYKPMMDEYIFAQGRENFHVNQDTVNFIMRNFFDAYGVE